jgi:hypothetical protein
MGFRIEAPKQDGNARFNTLKVNLNENNLATRVVVADEEGKFYYGLGGAGSAGSNGSSGTSGANGSSGSSGTSGTGFNTIADPLQGRVLLSDGSTNSASASANLFYDTGSSIFQVTGSTISSGGFTGSLQGTASWAINSLTASSADDFLVRGTLTAQTIVAQVITSSTEYITGSTIFGSQLTDTHQFTGSVSITGSLNVYGDANFYGPITGSIYGTASWAENAISSSYAPNIYNTDGELTGNRIMSGSDYNLTLNPSLTFNNPIIGAGRKYYYASIFSTATSSFATASVLVNANTTQVTNFAGLYGIINQIHLKAENQGNSTQAVSVGIQSQAGLTGVYTSSRMYIAGARIFATRFGSASSSLDESNNVNNYLAGQEISATISGGSGGVTSSYTGTHLGLNVITSTQVGTVGNSYGIRIQNLVANNNAFSSGSRVINHYGIKLETSIGAATPLFTSSIDNYFGLHMSAPVIGSTGRLTSPYGIYAESSLMRHYFNGRIGVETNNPAYHTDVVSNTRTRTNAYFGILSNPGTVTATPSISGGNLPDGTYYYVITALDNYSNQTTSSLEVSASISGGGNSGSVSLSWTAVSGAPYYRIYRGTTSGVYTIYYTSQQATPSYIDIGSLATSGSIPDNNYTGITQIQSNGNVNVGSAVIKFGNASGPPLYNLEISRLTGWGVSTGIVIGNGNTAGSTSYITTSPVVLGDFNYVRPDIGRRVFVIGDGNNITGSTAGATPASSFFIGSNNTYLGGVYITAIGQTNTINTSNVGNGCSIVIGRDNKINYRSVVIGADVESTSQNQLVIGMNNNSENLALSDVYFGTGPRNKYNTVDANFGNGFNVTINASGPTASADLAGGSLILAGGKGTGAGTPGDVIISTPAKLSSGVTLQSLTQRVWIKGDTGNVGVNVSSPTLATLQVGGNVYATSFTGSLFGTASWSTNAISSSYPIAVTGSTLYSVSPRAGLGASVNNGIFLGLSAGNSATNSNSSIFLGYFAGSNSTNSGDSNFIGANAGSNVTGSNQSNFIGDTAGINASNAYSSNFLGANSGLSALNSYQATFVGRGAGSYATNANGSIFLGYNSGRGAISASYSILIGYQTGLNPGGEFGGSIVGLRSNNIIIGNNITLENERQNSINFGGLIFGTGSYSDLGTAQFSGSANGRIGINQPLPEFSLDVSGSGRFTNDLTVTGSLKAVGNTNTGSLIFYTEATGSFPLFRIYNSREGISNPGLLTSSFNESFGVGSLMSSSISNNRLFRNVALGAAAMRSVDNSRSSIAIGVSAMLLATGSTSAITGSIAIGDSALGRQLGGSFNIAIGTNAMLGVSSTQANTGDRNIAIGAAVLTNNTTGQRNSSVGDSSLATNSVGSFNTANGNRALIFNTSGSYNSAIGVDALRNNTTASYGTAIGGQALYDSLTGDRNIAIGWDSGRGITSGRANTIIGSVTGLAADLSNNIILADGDGNIRASHNAVSWSFSGSISAPQGFTGSLFGTASWANNSETASFVLNAISSSYVSGSSAIITYLTSSTDALINGLTIGKGGGNLDNIAIGNGALVNNVSGNVNIAIGTQALSSSINSSVAGNIAIGYRSLYNNISSNNVAVGFRSLEANTIGLRNVAVGVSALITNTSGSNNVAMGLQALLGSTTGNGNTAIGYRAGYGTGVNSNTTGENNIFIGNISVGVSGSDSNRTWIGNTSTTSTWLGGNLILGQTSDFGPRLQVTGNVYITGSLIVSQGITGSLFGTSSWAISASWAPSNGGSSQWTSSGANIYYNTGNVSINKIDPTATLDISGSVIITGSLFAPSITGSLFGTSSWAISSSYSISSSNSISSSYSISSSNSISSSWAISASWAPSNGGSSQWTSSGANIFYETGNVGVKNNNPTYDLDVTGKIRITTSLGVGVIPSSTTGRIDALNDIVAYSSSDIRFKTNLKPIEDAISKVNKIAGYEFDWIPDQENHGYEGRDIGVIAQEIEEVLPEIVTTRDSGYKAVKYEKIVPLLIEAIKDQQKQIDELKSLLKNKE